MHAKSKVMFVFAGHCKQFAQHLSLFWKQRLLRIGGSFTFYEYLLSLYRKITPPQPQQHCFSFKDLT